MAKTVEYVVRVCKDGQEWSSVRMAQGCEDVEVGRSHQCALGTPPGDRSVSGLHARIFWKGRRLYVADAGSRNGVQLAGRPIGKPCKVKPGMELDIGNCILDFELQQPAEEVKVVYHKLEFLNGDHVGREVEIRPREGETEFTIGFDSDNTLALPVRGVSHRRHAILETLENGECWLVDCNSTNGTYVNGEKVGSKRRMLKDNDRITIASSCDFRFLDGSKKHKRLWLWVKVFAVAATLCVMGGLYFGLVQASDKAGDFKRLAENHAAAENFDMALKVLEQARFARDYPQNKVLLESLRGRIEKWKNTAETWKNVKEALSKGKFAEALEKLDPIVGGNIALWGWNGTGAVAEKNDAAFAASALRAVTESEDALGNAEDGQPEQQADQMRSAEAALKAFQDANRSRMGKLDYLAAFTNHLAQTLAKLGQVRAGFEAVDEPIAKLDGMNPDFADLAVRLDAIARDPRNNGAVRAYAEKYKQPCVELAAAKKFIGGSFDDINAMRFAEVRKREKQLQLPRVELCQRHPQLSAHRAKLEGHHQDTQKFARGLDSLVNGLAEEFGVVNGNCGLPLKHILNRDSWKQVLAFPCFQEKPPTQHRKRPTGFYDELLGIDYTFECIKALPGEYNGVCLSGIGFSPDCIVARHALETVEIFVKFIEDSPKWMRKGDLGAFYEYCRKLLKERDAVVTELAAYNGSERGKLVAGFYAEFLARTPNAAKRRELKQTFRNLQKQVGDLCEKYENANDPVEQISIRAQILALALPGDSQIRVKWVQMYEGMVR